MRRIAILDAPSNLGLRPPTPTSVPGCAKAPGALRDHDLLARLAARDAGCLTPPRYDPGDWRPGDGVCHAEQISAYSLALADRIGSIIDGGEFPVVLGGDCSILLGSALAMHRLGEVVGGRIGLVFVDGHSDFRHPGNASYVGAAAGEDLALATGRGQADLAGIEGRRPYYRDIDVVVLGIRAQDEYRLDLQAAGIITRPVPALRVEGAARTAQWARDQLSDCAGYWLHIDVDVLDPAVMPAVDAPDPGGIAFAELELLLSGLVDTPHCLGVEITVFDPDYDPDGSYAAEIVETVVAGLAPLRMVDPVTSPPPSPVDVAAAVRPSPDLDESGGLDESPPDVDSVPSLAPPAFVAFAPSGLSPEPAPVDPSDESALSDLAPPSDPLGRSALPDFSGPSPLSDRFGTPAALSGFAGSPASLGNGDGASGSLGNSEGSSGSLGNGDGASGSPAEVGDASDSAEPASEPASAEPAPVPVPAASAAVEPVPESAASAVGESEPAASTVVEPAPVPVETKPAPVAPLARKPMDSESDLATMTPGARVASGSGGLPSLSPLLMDSAAVEILAAAAAAAGIRKPPAARTPPDDEHSPEPDSPTAAEARHDNPVPQPRPASASAPGPALESKPASESDPASGSETGPAVEAKPESANDSERRLAGGLERKPAEDEPSPAGRTMPERDRSGRFKAAPQASSPRTGGLDPSRRAKEEPEASPRGRADSDSMLRRKAESAWIGVSADLAARRGTPAERAARREGGLGAFGLRPRDDGDLGPAKLRRGGEAESSWKDDEPKSPADDAGEPDESTEEADPRENGEAPDQRRQRSGGMAVPAFEPFGPPAKAGPGRLRRPKKGPSGEIV